MSQTAAHLVDRVIPHVPVRQWVLSLPIPLRLSLAAQPELVTPVLQVEKRVVTRHLLDRAGLKLDEGHGGAVTLIQRFGSAANLNVHLHCLVLDGVYQCGANGAPAFVEVDAPTDDKLHALLQTAITKLMKFLTRQGVLVEDMGQTYLADPDAGGDEARTLRPLQAAAVTYRIAFGPRAGQVELKLKTPRRDGTTHLVMSPLEFMQRLAVLASRLRLHPPVTASRLSISGFGCPVRVGSSSSDERTADVAPASEVDQCRKTLIDCFGERAHSSGCRPMAAVL
jgi:hypothetical protein